MPNLVLDSVSVATPDGTPLFPALSLTVGREAVGLFGRNGSGKTTLLRAIAGDGSYSGSILCNGAIGFLRQESIAGDRIVADVLGAAEDLARLRRIEEGRPRDDDIDRADWTLSARLEAALAQVDLPAVDWTRPYASFSGGERMRLKLAALLLPEPAILLLDEPTNNLDRDGRDAIIRLLTGWHGAILCASHDRELLENVDRIVDLTTTGATVFGGAWSAFRDYRDGERARAIDALETAKADHKAAQRTQQRELEKQARRDKRGRAVAARKAEPKMHLHAQQQRAEKTGARTLAVGEDLARTTQEALRDAQSRVERVVPVHIELGSCGLSSRHVLVDASGVASDFGPRRLFGPLDIHIRGPERIALVGANGSGKTSLIRLLTGAAEPATGQIEADRDRIAVLDQHLALLGDDETLIAAMRRHNPALDRQEAHAALARFGFRGHWADRLAGALSGGEKVRLALACLFARPDPPQLLILDEPTNHLDIDAIELLEKALRDYDGAILCVSHDEAFCRAIALEREICL